MSVFNNWWETAAFASPNSPQHVIKQLKAAIKERVACSASDAKQIRQLEDKIDELNQQLEIREKCSYRDEQKIEEYTEGLRWIKQNNPFNPNGTLTQETVDMVVNPN